MYYRKMQFLLPLYKLLAEAVHGLCSQITDQEPLEPTLLISDPKQLDMTPNFNYTFIALGLQLKICNQNIAFKSCLLNSSFAFITKHFEE